MTTNLLPEGMEVPDWSTWPVSHAAGFALVILAGFELLSAIIKHAIGPTFARNTKIPMQSKHLDAFEAKDYACIWFNRIFTVIFLYYCLKFTWISPTIVWSGLSVSTLLTNFILPLPLLFLVYDLLYYWFHRFLHIPSVYGFVHKHHHRQHCPSRGNMDAVNVHPFEFVTGELNHLLALFLVSKYVVAVHASMVLVFILIGGVLASLNHTRDNVSIWDGVIYDVKAHDVHHRMPRTNYSQYTMFWDRVFGSFVQWEDKSKESKGKQNSKDK